MTDGRHLDASDSTYTLAGHSKSKLVNNYHTRNMAIMIEDRQWIDTEAEDWDQEIINDPSPPFFPEEVKFNWKDGMLQPVQEGQ